MSEILNKSLHVLIKFELVFRTLLTNNFKIIFTFVFILKKKKKKKKEIMKEGKKLEKMEHICYPIDI